LKLEQPYVDAAKRDVARSNTEKEEFKANAPPKRPPNPFSLFVKEQIQVYSYLPKTERLARVADQWRALPMEEKQKYYDAVEKLRMEYEQALEEYQIKQAEEDAL